MEKVALSVEAEITPVNDIISKNASGIIFMSVDLLLNPFVADCCPFLPCSGIACSCLLFETSYYTELRERSAHDVQKAVDGADRLASRYQRAQTKPSPQDSDLPLDPPVWTERD